MKRLDCLRVIAQSLRDELVVANIGMVRREWRSLTDHPIFPVSALGQCASVGLGLALALPHRTVIVLDGDGSILQNLNHFVTLAAHPAPNLIHVIFDNEHYEAAGVYPSNTSRAPVRLAEVARACGIGFSREVRTLEEFQAAYGQARDAVEPKVIVAKVEVAAEPPPEPSDRRWRSPDPIEYAIRFAQYIEETERIVVRKSPQDLFQGSP